MDLGDLFRLLIAGIMVVIFAYALVRSASFAYFRTKYEHLKRVMKATEEGDH